MATPRLSLPEVLEGQFNGEISHNTAIRLLEVYVQSSAISDSTTAEPASPNETDVYVVPAGATGSNWTGQDGAIAVLVGGVWVFLVPPEGWLCWIQDASVLKVYNGTSWDVIGTQATSIALIGMDANPSYTDPAFAEKSVHGGIVAPPTMLQAWTMYGLGGRPEPVPGRPAPLTDVMNLLDEAGYTSVVAYAYENRITGDCFSSLN